MEETKIYLIDMDFLNIIEFHANVTETAVFIKGGCIMLLKLIIPTLITMVIYLLIAAVLIVTGEPEKTEEFKKSIGFDELSIDYSSLPEIKSFKARDGQSLSYRHYSADSEKALILLHGSGWHSEYLLPLARFISSKNLANVYTPDLRGHGISPQRRGDIDYINQLEDDLADLVSLIKRDRSISKLIIGGHSSGGGLSIRFAGSRYRDIADGYILLSPFLKYNAPTMRLNSGGWANPYTRRIIGLTLLNNIGIHTYDYLPVITFNMPKKYRNGTETLRYSHRLNSGYAPSNYKKDLADIKKPILVVSGSSDEAFVAGKFEPIILNYTTAQVRLLTGVTHMGVVTGSEIHTIVTNWLEDL